MKDENVTVVRGWDGNLVTTTLNSFGRGTNWTTGCFHPKEGAMRTSVHRNSLEETMKIEIHGGRWVVETWHHGDRGSGAVIRIGNGELSLYDRQELTEIGRSEGFNLPDDLKADLPVRSRSEQLAHDALMCFKG